MASEAARMAQLKSERQTLVRQLAAERDTRKKLLASVTQLSAQVATVQAEQERLRGKVAIAADAPSRLQGTRDECEMLRNQIETKETELGYVKAQYKQVEARLMEAEGAMVHHSVAAKRGIEAVQAAQRVKDDKKVIAQLQKQEATLATSIREARHKLDVLRGAAAPSSSTVDSPSRSSAGQPDIDHTESLTQVQLDFERRRRQAVAETQEDLNRLDRELDRRKGEVEAREQEKRSLLGSQVARAESDRSTLLREQASLKTQQHAAAQRSEDLRRRIAQLDKDNAGATDQCEKLDLEALRLTRRVAEINAALDADLRKGALASTHATQAADAWKSEKAQLQSSAASVEKRVRELKQEVKRNKDAIAKIESNGSGAPAEVSQGQELHKAIDTARSLTKQARDEAARVASEALDIEARNATSQKDVIIEQLKAQLAAAEAATAATSQENAELTKRLATVQEALKRNNLSL